MCRCLFELSLSQAWKDGWIVIRSALFVAVIAAGTERARVYASDDAPACVPPVGLTSIIPTEHFLLFSDADRRSGEAVAERLEPLYAIVVAHLRRNGVQVAEPAQRMNIVMYENPEVLAARAERAGIVAQGNPPTARVSGFYNAGANAVYLAEVGNRPPGELDPALVLTLQHEVVHLILANVTAAGRASSLPPWLAEGLACQFEGSLAAYRAEQIAVSPYRLSDLRGILGLDATAQAATIEQLRDALDRSRLIPSETFINRKGPLEEPPAFAADRYAQSWASVYSLRIAHPDLYRAVLRDALNKPAEDGRAEIRQNVVSALGDSDAEAMLTWINAVLAHDLDPTGSPK
ncbi:MAG: DUF1570 domain-containing protein [Phycisphaerae bacterium]|nr:DUF1570 domain-containing protein [Phycisphaerae bacterium]